MPRGLDRGAGAPPLGGTMSKREPQTILKTDERAIRLELGAREFTAKSSSWDESRLFLQGDKLEVAVKNDRGGPVGLSPAASNVTSALRRNRCTVTPALRRNHTSREGVTFVTEVSAAPGRRGARFGFWA
jgi:hypothetical protein